MDSRGVMGMPVKLCITFLLLSLCIPPLYGMASDFEERTGLEEAESQADKLISAMKRTYYGGTGTSENLTLGIPAGYEIIPGGDDALAYSVSIYRDGNLVETEYTSHPSVRVLGGQNALSGFCEVCVRCVSGCGSYGVEVVAL